MKLVKTDTEQILVGNTENWRQFQAWVENTKLFDAIIQYSGNPGVVIEGFDDNSQMSLILSKKQISTFEELPVEVLIEFFKNSPFSAIETREFIE